MILIPENEDRQFKYGILPNKLKYTIIYDKNSDTSNVVMSVRTGSLYEPVEFMGLAHFLEHMLFMGSKKYTDEDYFSAKLKELGGTSNAYTDNYQTVYYFNVLSNNLDKIIDIFSRFFIDPLFDINSVSREINAVNSEHLKNYNNDIWILRQVVLNLAEKDHIINRFSTGSHETLGSDIKKVRDAMIKFYNSYYCSNNMCLTIQSNKPIKDIEKMIKECFCNIKEKKVVHPEVPIKKYKHYNNEYQLTTVRDADSIVYFWELPDFYNYKDDKIIDIISNTINLNCKKNLENMLIEAKLISNIDVSYLDVGIFILSIDVLPNINKIHLDRAINVINDMVKYYFNNLKTISNISWNKIYDYNIKSYELLYNNRTKEENMDLATNISNNMHYYDEPYIYSGSKIVIKKDYNKLYQTLELLTFDKANIIYVTNKKLLNKKTEGCKWKVDKYYGKKYCKLEKTPDRNPNGYKEYDFNIHINEDILNINPKVIKHLDKYNKPRKLAPRFWYGGVSKFNEPIVIGKIIINSNKFFNKIISYITTVIAIECINYYIQLLFCNEIDIGNSIMFSYNANIGTITLNIFGLNDKYINLINKVILEISKIQVSNDRIETELNIFKKALHNIDKISPWEMSTHILSSMVNKYAYYYKDELKELNNIKINLLIDMVKKKINSIIKLQNLPLTTIIYGNINANNELKKCLTYKKNLNIELDKIPIQKIPKNITIKHPNKAEVNCCISFVFSILKGNNMLLSAKLLILANIIERPAFDELRTKAQLGYLVACKLKLDEVSYIKLSVQSAKKPELVEELMNKFINTFVNDLLNNMNELTFKQIKKSVYDNILEKANSILDMAGNYINEILIQDYMFDRKERVAEKIKDVSLNDIKQLYHSIIKEKSIIKII